MFLTFKNNQPARDEDLDPGMEQVAALRAGPATPRGPVRALRRPACIACQAKKLRCTGSERRCERCLSHSLACIFPPPKPKAQHRGRGPGRLGGTAGGSARSGHLAQEDDQTIRVDQEAATATADSVDAPASWMDAAESYVDTADMFPSPDSLFDNMATGLIGEGIVADIAGRDQYSNLHGSTPTSSPVQIADRAGPEEPATLPAAQEETPAAAAAAAAAPPLAAAAAAAADPDPNPAADCSCMASLVRVMQQLDDDEFRLTSLALDELLQLKKWLLSKCCAALECRACRRRPTTLTLLLSICDRLSEMFACLSKRVQRFIAAAAQSAAVAADGNGCAASAIGNGNGNGNGSKESGAIAADTRPEPESAHLFDGATGIPAISPRVACNPQYFSPQFRGLYSDEEQVHMIHALLRLHVRNFRQLLLRIEEASAGTGTSTGGSSQARLSKVRAMIARLDRAAPAIDAALQTVLDSLA